MEADDNQVLVGTDNVLLDLAFPDAEHLTEKVILAKTINDLIDSWVLSQTEAARILAMPQPTVSAIRNYRLRGISLKWLKILSHVWMAPGLQGFYSVFGLVACGHVSGLLMRSDMDRWP